MENLLLRHDAILVDSVAAHNRLGGMMWLVWHAPVGRWNTG